jgi:hypothetical protein
VDDFNRFFGHFFTPRIICADDAKIAIRVPLIYRADIIAKIKLSSFARLENMFVKLNIPVTNLNIGAWVGRVTPRGG